MNFRWYKSVISAFSLIQLITGFNYSCAAFKIMRYLLFSGLLAIS